MTRRARTRPSLRRWGALHVAGAAVLVLASASLVREERDEHRGVADVVSAPPATRSGSSGVEITLPAVTELEAPGVSGLASREAGADALRGAVDRHDDAEEARSSEEFLAGVVPAAPAAPPEAPGATAVRTPKPERHSAIATRLGWTPGDGREELLAAWLERARDAPASDLVALFGSSDAAAIERDLAPVAVSDEH